MPTITDLHKVYLRQLELVLAESDLLLQKEGGLDGELKTSGSLCEQFLRQTFSKYVVPGQFRVTSGYIATPQLLAEKKNLPQCDLLIADSHIPPLLQLSSSTIEVLPIEATIGLIGAKRTLTKKTLADALDHLAKVIDSTGRASTLKTDRELNRYNKYVGFDNSSSDKPLIGVVGLNSSFSNFGREVSELIVEKQSLVDFVWTLDGFALVPSFQTSADTLLHYTHTARPDTKTWTHLTEADFSATNSNFYRSFSGKPIWMSLEPGGDQSREAVFAKVIGLVSLTISRVAPGSMQEQQVSDYYLSAR
ncbi:DUF6602 domain-containing protein [Acidovorax kalamii]|uniref:DUF6602 domain-containing protein n=1 Tax=Acidovorax kalamii TaxID=2004485 RepID=UPI0020900EAB|nr:DUF6602 domain-containing protein [Acidovorax kalamii]MCO5354258.1 hypothetical protein [Acidovorax kalamii]